MGTAASSPSKPKKLTINGGKLVVSIVDKRGRDENSSPKPSPSVQLEVDLANIVSPWINVMFVCGEWGSKKGGISTFNRELAVNVAKISNDRIRVHCYVSESSEAERKDASSRVVNLITAQRSPGSNDPLDWLSTEESLVVPLMSSEGSQTAAGYISCMSIAKLAENTN